MNPDSKIAAVVTGAGGWLGKGLINALMHGIEGVPGLPMPEAGSRLRVLLMRDEPDTFFKPHADRIDIVRGDVRSPADCATLMQGAEGALLYHTAGIIHPGKVAEFDAINFHGTMNVVVAAEAARLRRAVIVSSNSPIGCNPAPDHVFDEAAPFNPYMGYGRSKMRMEQAILARPKSAMEIVRIRAPWFYGPFQPARQALFFQMIRDGKGPIVGSGRNMRSMAYIDNLAQGLILAGQVPQAASKVYWIADEHPYSMNEIIDTIESVIETDFSIPCMHKRLKLPSFASDIAFMVDGALQSVGIYHQKFHVLSEMNKTIACSIALARTELGYRPTIALREGMRRSIAWMRESGQTITVK